MPKISVVVPVYNVEPYLNRCVDSILNQSFEDFDLVLVDDGSPDNCGKICDQYAEKDKRITVIHKDNGGLSDARNAGIDWALKNSDSEWITFIDSDDWIHPEFLCFLYKAACENEASLSMCCFKRTSEWDAFKPEIYEFIIVGPDDLYDINRTNAVVAWGKLYKKKDFIEIKYPYGKIFEDLYTTYKLLFKYQRIAYVQNELIYYFNNNEGLSHSEWKMNRLDELEAQKNLIVFLEKRKSKAINCNVEIYVYYLARAIQNIRNSFPESLEINKGLKKELKRYLRKYNTLSFKIKSRKDLVYSTAYPVSYKIYKILKKKISNLKEILHLK